jgi:hypothetical protein
VRAIDTLGVMSRRRWVVLLVLVGCSDKASDRASFAKDLRPQFDQAYIYAEGDENTTLVAEMDCDRLFAWPQVGSLNNRGFRNVKCQLAGEPKVFDLTQPLPKALGQPAATVSNVEHDYGCPVAARRLLKKMTDCGLETEGTTEDFFCAESSKIDSKVVRMLSNSDDCHQLEQYLNLK